ncbi:tetratricopeptide repeat protein [Nonomuraea sp. NPDC049637]|uniref:tetratricopeptide repeat protein n=1 Tax=Nonomuraea sp. NPDC049637 TaxID=3154356 RepID=UPI003425A390
MDPVSVVGVLTGVAAAVIAALQLHRTPRRRNAVPVVPPSLVVPAVEGQPGALVVPVLRAPVGRLPQVHGRQGLLLDLEQRLTEPDGNFHVLGGLGGVGKTTVALALAERAQNAGRPVWWIAATDVQAVTSCLLALAAELGASATEIEEARTGRRDAADVLWGRLEERTGWLLVLDNADDPATLEVAGAPVRDATGWLRPTTSGLLVVTSRTVEQRVWGRYGRVHHLSCLSEDDGARALLDLAGHAGSPEQARTVSRRLGGLPLALSHAGNHIASPFSTEQTFPDYLLALDDRFPRLLGSSGAAPSIATTWEISLDALAERGCAQARPLLRVLACLAPAVEIDAALLDDTMLGEICGGEHQVRPGLEALSSMGLIEVRGPTRTARSALVVHPLVAEASRTHVTSVITTVAIALMRGAVDGRRHDTPSDWPVWQQLMPHLRALLSLAPAVLEERALGELAGVVSRGGGALRASGYYAAAAELATLSLRQADVLGADHPRVLALRHQRGGAWASMVHAVEAEAELADVLRARSAVLGEEHPDTLASRHEFGFALFEQGRYVEAHRCYEQTLSVRARVLGADHPDTLATWHEIGRVLSIRGLLDEAEAVCRSVVEARAQVLGPEHPDTLASRFYHVRAIGDLGDYAMAEKGYAELVAARARVIGPDHHLTLRTRFNMLMNVALQGHTAEAATGMADLAAHQSRVLGPGHPDILLTRSNRGWMLRDLGRHAEAEHELGTLVASARRVWGDDHIYTLDIRYELARTWRVAGAPDRAERELRDVLRRQVRVLGPAHLQTIATRYEIARVLEERNLQEQACREYRAVIELYRGTCGPDHPQTKRVEERHRCASLQAP